MYAAGEAENKVSREAGGISSLFLGVHSCTVVEKRVADWWKFTKTGYTETCSEKPLETTALIFPSTDYKTVVQEFRHLKAGFEKLSRKNRLGLFQIFAYEQRVLPNDASKTTCTLMKQHSKWIFSGHMALADNFPSPEELFNNLGGRYPWLNLIPGANLMCFPSEALSPDESKPTSSEKENASPEWVCRNFSKTAEEKAKESRCPGCFPLISPKNP